MAEETRVIHTAWVRTITQDVTGEMTPNQLLAHFARISNPGNEYNHETGPRLLKRCADRAEWSPFEQVDVGVEIFTTRDVGRQIIRHRSFSFQEYSQRYADPTEYLGFTYRLARLQDKKNRQSSIHTDDGQLQDIWQDLQTQVVQTAQHAYKKALELGIAKEVARAVLPEGLTVTRMYMKGNIRNWMHYLKLRMDGATQYEHRQVARAARASILEHLPAMADFLQETNA